MLNRQNNKFSFLNNRRVSEQSAQLKPSPQGRAASQYSGLARVQLAATSASANTPTRTPSIAAW